MECVIDTNVLVDYILLDSELHEKAKEGLEKIENGFVPAVVIEELVQVLGRLGVDKMIINEKIREVLASYEIISLDRENFLEAQKIINNEKGVQFKRFNDKLVLSAAKQNGLPLFTFDGDLKKECNIHGVKLLYE